MMVGIVSYSFPVAAWPILKGLNEAKGARLAYDAQELAGNKFTALSHWPSYQYSHQSISEWCMNF